MSRGRAYRLTLSTPGAEGAAPVVEPADWVARLGGPPASLIPTWPPATGLAVVMVVSDVSSGVHTEEVLLILDRDRLDEMAGVEPRRRKLFFQVPARALADAVPAIADAVLGGGGAAAPPSPPSP